MLLRELNNEIAADGDPVRQSPSAEMPKDTRLLLWAPNGSGLHYNGPGMSAYRLLSKLAPADRLKVTLAHGFSDQRPYPLFADQALIAPVTASLSSQIGFIWQGKRWLSRHRHHFDVFYGLQAFDFTVGPALHASNLGIPAIVKVVQHNSDLAPNPGWRALLARAKHRRLQLARLAGVVAISDAIATELLRYGIPERKIARIPNGVDTDHFRPLPTTTNHSMARTQLGWIDEVTVLFVGAIVPRKRPHLLIEALGILRQRGISPQLVLAGPVKDLAYGAAMRVLAADLGVADQINWQGFIDDTARAYHAADIFALTSSNEGMPNALLEAMASGLPSVVTPITGTGDLVRDGVEAVYVTPDAKAVADALADYILSPRLRAQHGGTARHRALTTFSARHILERHLQLYQRVLSGQDAAEA